MNLSDMHKENENNDNNIENDIIIRGYTPIGSIRDMGKIEIEAREVVIPERKNFSYFIKISIESYGQYPQNTATLIQYDNIDKLIMAIDKIGNAKINSDRFSFSEIQYDIDGFSLIVFNNDRGKIMFAATTGTSSAHFNNIDRIFELKKLIQKSKDTLDTKRVES